MSERATVTQTDIKRAVKGAIDAGLSVARVDIDGSKISIFTTDNANLSPLEGWEKGRGQGGS